MKTIPSRIVLLFALALTACSRPIRSASAEDPGASLSSGGQSTGNLDATAVIVDFFLP